MKDPQILDLYSEYLIASFNLATATGLSKLLDEVYSHDQISRFLGQGLLTQKDYWRCIKPIIRKIERPCGIIKIDDTIEHKPHSKENDIICYHWDHANNRSVKGINIINFLYQSPINESQSLSLPLAFELIEKKEQWLDKKTNKIKRRSARKKNTIVRERLRIIHHFNKVPFRYLVWDSWFSSKENFDFVHFELKKYFVSAIKNNRLVALNEKDQIAGQFQQVKQLTIQKDRAITVWLKGIDFPMRIIKRVFTNKDGSKGELYTVTNDLDLEELSISTIYDERWGVEVFHKGLKQNVGLEKSPTKNRVTQANHVFACMIAWAKLEMLAKWEVSNQFALKARLYVKALQAAFEELQLLKSSHLKLESANPKHISLLR